jgi:hypothetical protein
VIGVRKEDSWLVGLRVHAFGFSSPIQLSNSHDLKATLGQDPAGSPGGVSPSAQLALLDLVKW